MMIARPTAEAVGRLLPQFRRLKLLARGGFGDVYEAVDLESAGRRVALKVMVPLSTEVQSSFLVTARAEFLALREFVALRDRADLRKRERPSLMVEVFDFGTLTLEVPEGARGVWFTMELCIGALTPLIPQLPLASRRIVALQLLQALAELHSRKIAHQDLKPDNIYVWPLEENVGQLRLGDFGLARREVWNPTSQEELRFSPRYAAPELFGDPSAKLDPFRADQYSAGLVIYEVLSRGAFPFDVSSASRLATIAGAHLPRRPLVVADFNRNLSDLRWALERMLCPDPQDRFESMVGALDAVDTGLRHAGWPQS